MTDRIHVRCPNLATRLIQTAAELLESRAATRPWIAGPVELGLDPGIGTEGYRIEDGNPGTRILGNDERGLIFGVGRFLRQPGWRGQSVPRRTVRGIYFATHFHNFYHDAPIAEIERYVEDLALWGCNSLSVWFDMHHYQGLGDPAAQAMIARLRAILKAASAVGIRGALTTLANEAYASSPADLRADWTAGHDGYHAPPGGHYHVEICPSKPGGLDLILKYRKEMLQQFADLDIGYVWIWPYDQGGCTCSSCAPWGGNGFLRTARPYAELVRQMLPDAKVVLSTWYFDRFIREEWKAFDRAMGSRKPVWADYLLVDGHTDQFPRYPLEHRVAGGLPLVNFPEISMFGNGPWGGFGAIAAPGRFQKLWDQSAQHLSGGWPYSEGIHEDMNKAVNLQHYWGDQDALETIRQYAAYEFAPQVAEEVAAVACALESLQSHELTPYAHQSAQWPEGKPTDPVYHLPAAQRVGVEATRRTLRCLEQCETELGEAARASWRWRILMIRATLDCELTASSGRSTSRADACFEELVRLYHAQSAEPSVCPPSLRQLERLGLR